MICALCLCIVTNVCLQVSKALLAKIMLQKEVRWPVTLLDILYSSFWQGQFHLPDGPTQLRPNRNGRVI